jgi:hypothetical protein
MILSTGEVVPSVAVAPAMSGTFKVGTTEVSPNFTSLAAAVEAINTSNITGNIVLEISSDLTEPANIGLGVNSNSFGITIRPDADVDRTITFTQLSDNASPTGHLVIGYQGVAAGWTDANTIATNNVTIDGFAVGGTTKRLKFTNLNADVVGARVLVVVGACQNTTIKNCIVENKTTNTGSPTAIVGVLRKGTSIEVIPGNFVIENNTIICSASSVGMGIRMTTSGTATGTVTALGFVCKNNIISAQRRIIELNYVNGGEISGNTISISQPTSTTLAYGIWTSTGCAGTFNIFGNKIISASVSGAETSGTLGLRALSLGGSVTCNVYNNMFAGMNRSGTATGSVNQTYCFFACTGNIYNNTFYMPALTATSIPGYYTAIQLSTANPNIKNNIFISNEDAIINAFYSAVTTGESDYNIFYNRVGTTKSLIVTGSATFLAYRGVNPTKDSNSKSVNVNFENAATGDLRIAGLSVQDNQLRVPSLTAVITDILSTVRNTEFTYAGAHESTLPFLTTEVDNTKATPARIIRTSAGIEVQLDREASIELYDIKGMLIDNARVNGTYTRNLNAGIYIIRIDGKATKFVK